MFVKAGLHDIAVKRSWMNYFNCFIIAKDRLIDVQYFTDFLLIYFNYLYKRNLSEVESRTQHSRPKLRTQKKSVAKAKDQLFEDRSSRGQIQKWSRLRPKTEDTMFLNYDR